MAHRHLLTVCVVCLLSAHHLPCKEHLPVSSNAYENNYRELNYDLEFHSPNDDVGRHNDVSHYRVKRHANHEAHHANHHHLDLPEVTLNYIGKIFRQFNESKKMNLHDFENMISYLKLKHLFSNLSKECINEETFLEKMSNRDEHEDDEHEEHNHNEHDSLEINSDQLLAICPILLYHSMSSVEPNMCLKRENFLLVDTSTDNDWTKMEDRNKVWLYSFLSIFLVSLSGLLGVAVIPIMDKHYYHHVLQFLVALAVGTLAGDALLHLLPHSMLPLTPDQDLHTTMMYRGLAALLGIIFFYFFERFLTMVTEMRQRKEKRDKPSSRVRVMRDPETASLNGTTTCKHKYSSYPYCYGEIAMETKDDHHEHQHIDEATVLNNQIDMMTQSSDNKKMNGIIHDNSNDLDNNTLSTSLDEGSIESNALCNNNKHSGNPVSNLNSKNESVQQETYTVILRYV
jgi:ZIP Zinc transporter